MFLPGKKWTRKWFKYQTKRHTSILHTSSCHVYHSKKSIPFGQALRLNRICSENSSFDKLCNQLELWLRERGYSDKLVRPQVLKARKHKRKNLLKDMKDERNDYKLVFNITYHPNFSDLNDTMSFLHLLLTPDQEHQKVFHKIPVIGFSRAKGLKDICPSKEKWRTLWIM